MGTLKITYISNDQKVIGVSTTCSMPCSDIIGAFAVIARFGKTSLGPLIITGWSFEDDLPSPGSWAWVLYRLQGGAHIRRPHWPKGRFIKLTSDLFIRECPVLDGKDQPVCLDYMDFTATNWEEL